MHETVVTIYLDNETETMPTTKHATKDGKSNVYLMRLHLNKLSAKDKIWRHLGQIRDLYIFNEPKNYSESASEKDLQISHTM